MKLKEFFTGRGPAEEAEPVSEADIGEIFGEVPSGEAATEDEDAIAPEKGESYESHDSLSEESVGDTPEDHAAVIARLKKQLRLAEKERVARERELRSLEILAERGLPASLSTILTADGVDMEAAAADIRRTVDAEVAVLVSQKCRTATPEGGSPVRLTPEDIRNTPVADLQRMRLQGVLR